MFQCNIWRRKDSWTEQFFVKVLGITEIFTITGMPHFIVLCRYFIFYKLKVYGNPMLTKPIGIISPTSFAHFGSLCFILVILAMFQTSSLLYLLWWSVVRDLWCYCCNYFGEPWTASIRWGTLLINVYVLTASLTVPGLSPSPPASLFPETQQY